MTLLVYIRLLIPLLYRLQSRRPLAVSARLYHGMLSYRTPVFETRTIYIFWTIRHFTLMWAIKQFMFTRYHRSATFGQQSLFVDFYHGSAVTPTLLSWLGRHTNCGSTNPSRFVVGTFNARGFHSATKRDQLSDDLGRLHIDVCCLQETKCPGGFDERCGNYRHIGMPSQSRYYGLASSVSMQFENKIVRY